MKYLLLLLLPLLAFSSCDLFGGNDEPEPEHLRRTVLVYWAAQNTLGYAEYQKKDSLEIAEGVPYLRHGERLLLFVDDAHAPRLYEWGKDYKAPQLVRRWESDVNSADAETLRELLAWVKQHYVSDEYGLVLASHASGWVPSPKRAEQQEASSQERLLPSFAPRLQSYGMDVGPKGNMLNDHGPLGAHADEMDIEPLAVAIQQSGMRPRFILFDCCLMQNIEVLYALRHTTDYIMASPIAISAEGAPYTQLMKSGLFSQDITDLGRSYVDYYQQQFERYPQAMGIVESIVRTDRVEAIATALAQVLPARQTDAEGQTKYWDMGRVQKYAVFDWTNGYRPHYYDLNDALRQQLDAEAHARVKAAIDAAIVYKGATARFFQPPGRYSYEAVDLAHYCGISMFVPQAAYTEVAGKSRLGDLNKAFQQTAWYKAAGWQQKGW